MMYIIVVCAFFTITCAAVLPEDSQAAIVSYDNKNDGSGTYNFGFLTSNGIEREETGRLVNVDQNNAYIFVTGSYSYRDPDGQAVRVRYIADQNGYHSSADIPLGFEIKSANDVASLLGK